MYDYVDGKFDWLAAGFPSEGTSAGQPRAGTVARRDVPTSQLDEPIGEMRERVLAAGWDACVVMNDERIVLGFLREDELEKGRDEPDAPVERVMRPGPSTFRPHVPIEEMAHFMIEHDLPTSPVTSSDGRLIGILRRQDAVAIAHGHEQHDGTAEEAT